VENRILRQKDEKNKNKLKCKSNSSRGSRSSETIFEEEGGLSLGDYYQQPSHIRRQRRDHIPKETRVDLPYFQGKDDVKAYLDCEMKVEQLFSCHQVRKGKKVPLLTFSFQGYAMYWWTSLVQERLHSNDPPIEYWNDLKSTLRRRNTITIENL